MKKLICVMVVLLAMTLGSALAEDAAVDTTKVEKSHMCVNSLCPGKGWAMCVAATIGIIVAAGAIAIGDKP